MPRRCFTNAAWHASNGCELHGEVGLKAKMWAISGQAKSEGLVFASQATRHHVPSPAKQARQLVHSAIGHKALKGKSRL